MNTDLVMVGQYLENAGLWDKYFRELSEEDIRGVCAAIVEATCVEHGFKPPYIDQGTLAIPFQSPKKYRWWQEGGQSILETLDELGVGNEIKKKYTPTGHGEGLQLGVKKVCDDQARGNKDG